MYIFKTENSLIVMDLHRSSCWAYTEKIKGDLFALIQLFPLVEKSCMLLKDFPIRSENAQNLLLVIVHVRNKESY